MILPKQKISNDDRYSVSKLTGLNNIEETAEYYLNSIINDNDSKEIISLYRMLDDYINEEDYNYILNPFNTKIEKYKRFRGRLRNFNIIAPVVEMLLSEFGRRNHYPNVIQSNPNDSNDKQKALDEILRGYQAQNSVNILNSIGVPTGQESKDLPPLEQLEEDFERTYKEERVITGQEALDYIIYDKELQDLYIDMYKDYLVCGRVISFKSVNHDDVHFEHIHPLDYYFPFSRKNTRLEDRDWGIQRLGMTPNQLLDFHRGHLSKALIKKLEDYSLNYVQGSALENYSGFMYMSDDDFNNYYSVQYNQEENIVEHYRIQFKSFKRIAILTYINLIGEEVEVEVEDNYKLDKSKGDIKIEYDFINALYETYKIIFNGHEEYLRTREVPFNRAEVNNSSKVKLSFNGIALTTINGDIKSLVKSGTNYQVVYNILKYGFEKIMNKNKDKLAVIPLGLLNKGKQGWDEEKAMYYAESNSTLFIDETSPNAAISLQGIKVLDMSLGQYAKDMIQFIDQIKNEWWDTVGFNRQRFGETKASDGKAVTEQAIFRSALITENLLRPFERMQEKDYAGLLDLSKFAWSKGLKGQYINSDGKKALIEINEDNYIYYLESDFDVFVIFSGDENKKIEDLQAYLFNATQNGMSIVPVLEAMDTTSFTKMKEIIKKAEAKREALEQQNQEADRQNNLQIAELNNEAKQIESADKRYVADKQYEGAVEAAAIRANANKDEADELLNLVQTQHKMDIDEREQNRKEEETNSKLKKENAETKKINKETAVMTAQDKTNN